jgi:hypothetical protein
MVSVNGIGFNNESCFDNRDVDAFDNASVNDNDGDIFSSSSSFVFFEVDRITNASIFFVLLSSFVQYNIEVEWKIQGLLRVMLFHCSVTVDDHDVIDVLRSLVVIK